ncbi:ABC transporter ATP-binding protein [Falsigemmobacter faecalis]|uniref:ABC transporter ATP-binding protein n=1 Tax=Falsigemmobacter faecalis TaxID=2488730 RepID=A0A3P3DEW4_9RHOB|nr:ABC transporter ATP-binding protein [Falsigemmobacter faecalis]RRH72394.1 ABC transporter ATP-binding protein [Falsigemmobacter faecalis]
MSDLLELTRLKQLYPVKGGHLHAVDDVSFSIGKGESLGLVGESGCGKSTLVRLISRLVDPTEGAILLNGRDIAGCPAKTFGRDADRRRIQVVFQDPTDSLNPQWRVGKSIADPLRRLTKGMSEAEITKAVALAAERSGLPVALLDRFPHQLSGGQKARVGIARAIVLEPELLILDEPTSALDVSVQVLILKLLDDLRSRLGMSYLFVSHDLNVVRMICDRVAVMYLGKLVEIAPTEALFENPRHPYTRALLSAIPGRSEGRITLQGDARSPINPNPHVCRFYGRCPVGQDRCAQSAPLLTFAAPDHGAACHFA